VHVSRGSVQYFYRLAGGGGARHERTAGGVAGTRPRQWRGVTGAAWLGRRESMAAWRARVEHGWIRGRGGRFYLGLVGAYRGAVLSRSSPAQGCPAAWWCFSAGRSRAGEGERREREGEGTGPEFKFNFLQILNRNLKIFEHKSYKEFKNLQLLFYLKLHLSHRLKVI
jgi:hypothetical protein